MLRPSPSSRVHLTLSCVPLRTLLRLDASCVSPRRAQTARGTSAAERAFSPSTLTRIGRSPSLLASPSSLRVAAARHTDMATLTARRPHSTQSKGKEPEQPETSTAHPHDHDHDHASDHSHSHSHSHSDGIFSTLVHRHDHGEEGHSKDAEQIVQALQGQGEYRPSSCLETGRHCS